MPRHEPETGSDLVAARSPGAWSLMDLHSEVDRLFDEFARGFAWPRMGRGLFPLAPEATTMSTRVNIAETDSAYEIEAELPGLDEKDVEVNLSDDVLTISGERKEEKEEKKKDYHIMERRYGAFRRSFELPDNVAQDKIEAKFSKGILTVMLPKTAPSPAKANEKKIAIKSA